MPRTVDRLGVGLACVFAGLSLAAAGAPVATAETLSIASGSDPTAGMTNGVDYQYDTGAVQLSLTIIVRPSAGPACQATSVQDAQVAGADGTTYITPLPVALSGSGGDRVPYTYALPGSYRVCAWMYRSPDDVVSAASFQVDVRTLRADLAITASQVAPKAGGSDVLLRATGTTEAAADLLALAMPAGSPCPVTYDAEVAQSLLDVSPSGAPTRFTGAFDSTFQTRDLLSYRSWRICAYVQDGLGALAPSATAQTVIDMVVKPQLLRRPRVKAKGGGVTCDGGLWRAKPAAKYTYAWLAGGRRIAAGRTLSAARANGRAVSCRVTAKNRLGSSSATSKAVKAKA